MLVNARGNSFKWNLSAGAEELVAAVLCLVPLTGFLLAWHMQVDLRTFTVAATLPALLLLVLMEGHLGRKSPLLADRFATGLVGGLVATLVFDLLRLPSTLLFHGTPDFVPLIGQHLLHETIGIAPSVQAVVLGYGYHYLLIGALVGAAYALTVGRGRWHWAALMGLAAGVAFIELPQARLLTVGSGFDMTTASLCWVAAFTAAGAALGGAVQLLCRSAMNVLTIVFMHEERVEVDAEAPVVQV
jgi:hypothetical protein